VYQLAAAEASLTGTNAEPMRVVIGGRYPPSRPALTIMGSKDRQRPPVKVMPLVICFWAKKKIAKHGRRLTPVVHVDAAVVARADGAS
jgi:hypothetical protein